MRSEPPFSAWHVFVRFFALGICGQLVTIVGAFIEHPGEPLWARVAAWIVYVGFVGAVLFLVRDLWRELRLLGSRRSTRERLR
jgi:hypothetical protein